MRSWWSLYKRELRISAGSQRLRRSLGLIGLIGIGGFMGLAYLFRAGFISEMLVSILYFCIFIPAISMLSSLKREESRSPLWLQLPQAGWKLLSAKYAAIMTEFAAVAAVIFMLFLGTYHVEKSGAAWSVEGAILNPEELYRIFTSMLHGSEWQSHVMFVLVAFLLAGLMGLLYITATLFKVRLGWLGWPAAILLLGTGMFLVLLFEQSILYETAFQWIRLGYWQGDSLYLGDVLWLLIWTAVLFYVPAWMLDRKMEV